MKLEQLDPTLLKPNPWNTNIVSPENEQKLEGSIDRLGMFKPVIVRTLPDGTLQILGGEHRAEIAVNKLSESIPVLNLGVIDDTRAKEISLIDNGRYGSDDTLKLAELLEDLGGAEVLSTFTPFSDAEFESIFSAKSIDLDDLDLGEDDELPALGDLAAAPTQTHQIMRFKVAMEDADDVTELMSFVMKTQKLDQADSLTNAGDALVWVATKYREMMESENGG